MGIFGRLMSQVEYKGYSDLSYGLYDTLVVSFSRYQEFKRLMATKPPDERSRVIASVCVAHKDVYYCDNEGTVTKYLIEGD